MYIFNFCLSYFLNNEYVIFKYECWKSLNLNVIHYQVILVYLITPFITFVILIQVLAKSRKKNLEESMMSDRDRIENELKTNLKWTNWKRIWNFEICDLKKVIPKTTM